MQCFTSIDGARRWCQSEANQGQTPEVALAYPTLLVGAFSSHPCTAVWPPTAESWYRVEYVAPMDSERASPSLHMLWNKHLQTKCPYTTRRNKKSKYLTIKNIDMCVFYIDPKSSSPLAPFTADFFNDSSVSGRNAGLRLRIVSGQRKRLKIAPFHEILLPAWYLPLVRTLRKWFRSKPNNKMPKYWIIVAILTSLSLSHNHTKSLSILGFADLCISPRNGRVVLSLRWERWMRCPSITYILRQPTFRSSHCLNRR